ncbi:MAG: hypothetical protein ACOC9T_03195 [Myxococcota bacterium]
MSGTNLAAFAVDYVRSRDPNLAAAKNALRGDLAKLGLDWDHATHAGGNLCMSLAEAESLEEQVQAVRDALRLYAEPITANMVAAVLQSWTRWMGQAGG